MFGVASRRLIRNSALRASSRRNHFHSTAISIPRCNKEVNMGIMSMINRSQRRMMSSSAVVDDLVSILNREIESEAEANNDVMPEELAELKATIESDWRVVEPLDGSMTVKLFHKETGVGRAKISVELFCQEREDEDVGGDDDDEEDFSDELAAGVRFDAIVTKAGRALVFNCYSVGTEVRVEGVKIKSVDGLDTKDDTDIYEGPILEEVSIAIDDVLFFFDETYKSTI